ncbi:MAG TPA: hypothetical protein VGR40_02490, partial [Candidatus Binatus sp.]|nr:hypothetical protein [Candidatus Binatus sp.]
AQITDKGIDRQLHEAGWKAYDTVVGAAHAATGRVLTNQTVGQVLGTAIDVTLRWQRFNAAVAGAFFSAFWPSVGLPTANEIEGLRSDVRAMREELRDAIAERDSREDFAGDLHVAIRDSMFAPQAGDKPARQPGGHRATATTSDGSQFSVWTGWSEAGEDVGN